MVQETRVPIYTLPPVAVIVAVVTTREGRRIRNYWFGWNIRLISWGQELRVFKVLNVEMGDTYW